MIVRVFFFFDTNLLHEVISHARRVVKTFFSATTLSGCIHNIIRSYLRLCTVPRDAHSMSTCGPYIASYANQKTVFQGIIFTRLHGLMMIL